MPQVMMRWTAETRTRFREAFNAAVAADEEQFTFREHVFLTSYAGQLLHYFDMLAEDAKE